MSNLTSTAKTVHAVKPGYRMRSLCGTMQNTASKHLTNAPVDCPECLAADAAHAEALTVNPRGIVTDDAHTVVRWHVSMNTEGSPEGEVTCFDDPRAAHDALVTELHRTAEDLSETCGHARVETGCRDCARWVDARKAWIDARDANVAVVAAAGYATEIDTSRVLPLLHWLTRHEGPASLHADCGQ